MEESIVERVLILMKDYELTASEFADKIDVQRSSMSHLVSGRNKPSLDFIQKILNNFSDLNPTWLIMGTGPMKQLDIFDTKGAVAPIQPIPAENFRVEPPIAAAQQHTTKPVSEEDESSIADSKKVVYAQSAPTFAVIPEPIEAIQIQGEDPAPISVAPVPTIVPNPIQPPQPIAAISQELPVNPPKINQEVVVQAEKSVQNDKKVVKIVFFYSDNTFETFNPQ
jgi:transcriptional regulator with XRE-family HTH domain